MKTIRIFISSPGDVAEERDRARQVVEQLRRRYAGQFDLKAVLWEDLPLQADMSFQQGIDLVLSGERGIDIAIFILWSRLGSPTGAFVHKPDGSAYRSGTEREFDLIMAARQENQRHDPASDAPKILIYTRRDEASFDERLRGKPTDEKNTLLAQKKLVETFIQEDFHDKASGANVRAYHAFDRPVTFSQRLRVHLQEILDALAGGFAGEPVWDIVKRGAPFRGLEAFDFDHNPVFFGREDEVLEVRRALQRKAQEGCAFVLISGASGSGKSSLARAGVVPAVVEHEVDSTVSGWRYGVCAPSQFAGDLCGGLAQLLCTEGVLPELRDSLSVKDLGEGLAEAPKVTVTQSLRPALVRASQGKPGATRLLLLVDQLEELFTDKRLTDADRNRFVEVLEALARSGAVWVLATARSDFYQHCQRLPVLMRMKEGPGQIDLLPPTADALRRLIEQPARLAGLSFEERDGQFLAGRILTDATAHAELLPLVSYVLRELFEQRTPAGVLTFAAYEQLGGVEGALAKRAEAVFGTLPKAAQRELSPVLRALVSVSGDEEESVVRQRVPLSAFSPESPARVLVDRFVAERFLVTEKGAEGAGTVAVAHEALLRAWNQAAQWIADNREFLRVRARVAARMKEGSRLLEDDPLLEAARHQLAAIPVGFTPEQTAFIEECVRAVRQARRRRERLRKQVTVALGVLLLAALGGLVVAVMAYRAAQRSSKESDVAKTKAEAAQVETVTALEKARQARANAEAAQKETDAALKEAKSARTKAETAQKETEDALNNVKSARASAENSQQATAKAQKETEAKNKELQDQVREAARSDRLIALELFRQGFRHDAVVHLARASVYEPTSVLAAEMAVPMLNDWPYPLPSAVFPDVQSAQFSPDGQRVITASWDKTARVWDAGSGKLLVTLQGHTSGVRSAQFSPDGQWVVSASSDRTARVWDALSGKLLVTLQGHKGRVAGAQFSSDGRRVVTASQDKTAMVWDARSGKLLATLQGHEDAVRSAQFSPDGQLVLTEAGTDVVSVFAKDKTARVWDAAGGKLLATLLGHEEAILSAQFSPNGQQVVTTSGRIFSKDNTARVWDARSGKLLVTLQGHNGDVERAQFSPDGQRLATASWDKTARVWDWRGGKLLVTLRGHEGGLTSVQFSPDGQRVLTAASDNTARIWDADTGKLLTILQGHEGGVRSAQFSSDGQRVVTASSDNTARLWEPARSKLPAILQGHTDILLNSQFSPDGQRAVTASVDDTARVWDAGTGKLLVIFQGHTNWVRSAQFSPDGLRMVTASSDKTARIWDARTGELLATLQGHDKGLGGAQFSPDGRRVVTASADSTARVWDAGSGKLLATLRGHTNYLNGAEFSPDGQRVITTSADNTARLWDAGAGKLLGTLQPHDGAVNSAGFSPDGKQVVTASDDGNVRIWDADGGKLLATLQGHEGYVNKAQFSPDGQRVTSMSKYNNTIRVWEVRSGKPLAAFRAHGETLQSVEFSPNGQRLLTASDDRTARVWDAGDGKLLATLTGHQSYVNSAQFSPDGERIVTASADKTARLWELLGTTAAPPEWFGDFLHLMAQRKFNNDGELVMMPTAEFTALRAKLEGIVAAERSRYAAIARWFLAPAAQRPPRPGNE